jgi:hypothetical protein
VSYKREVIDIEVSRRILWVGAEAYPLHNIARAQTVKLVPNRALALARYIRAIALWVVLGLVAMIVTQNELVAAVVLVLIVANTVRLITKLSAATFYALVIETAGTPYRALVSTDENLVTHIVHEIMDAINNPQAEFQFQVENFHVGDKIEQFGNQNVGKVGK